jgi:hypothetical protein
MSLPSFSPRRGAVGIRLLRVAAILAIAFAATVVVVKLTSGEAAGRAGPKEQPLPTVAFQGKLDVVSPGRKPASAVAQIEQQQILAVLNEWYQRGFVDPRSWELGTFPEVAALLDAAGAHAAFARDVQALTLGSARRELKRLEPRASIANVTLYFDPGAKPRFAVASVSFSAEGFFKVTRPGSLGIHQKGTFYLRKLPRGWRVFAYDADQQQSAPAPTPAPGVPS